MAVFGLALPRPALPPRWQAWWDGRHPRSDTLELTQRNVYILPTRPGLLFAATLLVLLVASINYQLSLGYVLTFLLAGSGIVSMHVTHATLRGLTLHLRAPQPVFAGDAVQLECVLASRSMAPRHGIGLRLLQPGEPRWNWADVVPAGQTGVTLAWTAPRRGRLALPEIVIETRFPLGLFRAWTVWRPASSLLAYPAPEQPAAPLPAGHAVAGDTARRSSSEGGELDGVRSYRRGDGLKRVVWKKVAKTGELVSRETSASVARELWLDWQATQTSGTEARLSRLAAWVVLADRAGLAHGLRLPGVEYPPDLGDAHRRRSLEALALWV
jgi:uncharacterized protein (DUF58 family)